MTLSISSRWFRDIKTSSPLSSTDLKASKLITPPTHPLPSPSSSFHPSFLIFLYLKVYVKKIFYRKPLQGREDPCIWNEVDLHLNLACHCLGSYMQHFNSRTFFKFLPLVHVDFCYNLNGRGCKYPFTEGGKNLWIFSFMAKLQGISLHYELLNKQ